MKKFRNLLMAVFAVVLLAGCSMKENVSLNITSDKKMNLGVKLAFDSAGIDYMLQLADLDSTETKTYTDQDRMDYLKENLCGSEDSDELTCEVYKDGNFMGVNIKSSKVDMSEVAKENVDSKLNLAGYEGSFEDGALFVKEGDVYKSNFYYDLAGNTDIGSSLESIESYEYIFSVTLPNESISNNADTVSSDKLTLTWDLSKETKKDIDFSFKFDGTSEVTNGSGTTTTTTPITEKDNNDKLISTNTADTILGMTKTTFIIVVISVVLGLILISVLIIVFARKSTNAQNTKNNNQTPSETAQLFTNPTLSTGSHADQTSNTTTPESSDSVSVSEMTDTPVESNTEENNQSDNNEQN